MEIYFYSIVFYLLLIDAVSVVWLAWYSESGRWEKALAGLSRYLPITKGWALYYLFLTLFMGIMLYRLDALVLPFN